MKRAAVAAAVALSFCETRRAGTPLPLRERRAGLAFKRVSAKHSASVQPFTLGKVGKGELGGVRPRNGSVG